MLAKLLQTLTLLWPLIEAVDRYLDGDDEESEELKALPPYLRSRLALERAKRRSG